ncbi:hypothetical protein [Klebsiella variicola]|uniref:hypothetical protein n=1 Tax=Klebsiella variicola TaxID=244366 RepID=UPI0027311F3B|nr:hypothetical protein [Klebsiella variicola]MDP1158972.1 hypothetical protein [Klebsiella variicola]MDP1362637.1 hypothetical protein [Klebsiella variicola]
MRIIYLTDHDIDVLDKQTKSDILAYNKAVQADCPNLNSCKGLITLNTHLRIKHDRTSKFKCDSIQKS